MNLQWSLSLCLCDFRWWQVCRTRNIQSQMLLRARSTCSELLPATNVALESPPTLMTQWTCLHLQVRVNTNDRLLSVKYLQYQIIYNFSCVHVYYLQLYQTHQKILNGETSLLARSSCHGNLPSGMVELQLRAILLTNVNVVLTSGNHVETQFLILSKLSFSDELLFQVN